MSRDYESKDRTSVPSKDYYPMCLVWSPIPILTTFIPVIGHLGITTSEGQIHDFAGSYFINVTF